MVRYFASRYEWYLVASDEPWVSSALRLSRIQIVLILIDRFGIVCRSNSDNLCVILISEQALVKSVLGKYERQGVPDGPSWRHAT